MFGEMFICKKCGEVFEDPKIRDIDMDGEGYREPHAFCPECGSDDFEKAVRCAICGEWHTSDEMNGESCEDCVNKCRKDFDKCYKVSQESGDTENVEINSLIVSILEPSEINYILKEHIKSKMGEIDCSEFIDYDTSWFGDALSFYHKQGEK